MKTILDYPEQVIQDPGPDHIMWIFDGPFRLIDNFAPTPVVVDIGHGETHYRTSEHAFAAAKADTVKGHNLIASKGSPGAAKAAGRACLIRPDWEDKKWEVMWRVLLAKFDQNPDALAVLKATGDRLIYEGNYWDDRQWGVTQAAQRLDGYYPSPKTTWIGRNGLGQMLMEIRQQKFG